MCVSNVCVVACGERPRAPPPVYHTLALPQVWQNLTSNLCPHKTQQNFVRICAPYTKSAHLCVHPALSAAHTARLHTCVGRGRAARFHLLPQRTGQLSVRAQPPDLLPRLQAFAAGERSPIAMRIVGLLWVVHFQFGAGPQLPSASSHTGHCFDNCSLRLKFWQNMCVASACDMHKILSKFVPLYRNLCERNLCGFRSKLAEGPSYTA